MAFWRALSFPSRDFGPVDREAFLRLISRRCSEVIAIGAAPFAGMIHGGNDLADCAGLHPYHRAGPGRRPANPGIPRGIARSRPGSRRPDGGNRSSEVE